MVCNVNGEGIETRDSIQNAEYLALDNLLQRRARMAGSADWKNDGCDGMVGCDDGKIPTLTSLVIK